MTILPQLHDQLVSLPPAGERRRRRVPVLGALLATGLVLTGGALAAAGVIPVGAPFGSPAPKADPHRGDGALVPASARVLALRVPDPAGGPPWGLRVIKTTRGATCVQAGRVVAGRLGVVGRDGVAGDDGRFHPLPLTSLGAPGCVPDDAAGHAYVSIAMGTMASGPGPRPTCRGVEGGDRTLPLCPARDARLLVFGLLGPEVAAIGYHDGDHVVRQRIAAPAGGYLAVFARSGRLNGFSIGAKPSVGFAIRRIYYRDGSSCGGKAGPSHHPIDCPLAGYRPPQRTSGRGSIRRQLTVTGRHRLTVSFAAPVAVRSASRAYALSLSVRNARCSLAEMGIQTQRDFVKGARVTIAAMLPAGCRGTVRGTVALTSTAGTGGMPPALGDPGNRIVGRFTYTLAR
jgi:hypothetical protein